MSPSRTQVTPPRAPASLLPNCHPSSLFPPAAADTVDDAHDDLKREMSFYAASLNAVLWAQAECDKLHIPHKVPPVVSCTCAVYPLIP